MDWKLFNQSWLGTTKENRFYRLLIGALIVVLIVWGIKDATKDQVVVVVPPTLSTAEQISRSSASEGYLNAFSTSTAQLLGNVTPDNADYVKKAIGTLLDTSVYNDVMTDIDREILDFRTNRLSQNFDGRDTTFEPETGKFFVSGIATLKGPAGEPRPKEITYEFIWSVRNYRPILKAIRTYDGRPQTKDELKRLQDIAATQERLAAQKRLGKE